MENNKLIAEFMGVSQGEHTHFMVEPFALESYANVDDLKYHISWDWLMPVIEKIYQLDSNADFFGSINLEATYKEVVEFIKEQPHPPYTDLEGNTYI